jgi:hypothetical protein
MAGDPPLKMQLNWRGKLAKVGLEVASLAAYCHLHRTSSVIALLCVRQLMKADCWCR